MYPAMVRFNLILGCLVLFTLAACTSPRGFSNDAPQVVAQPDKVSALLADAATRASSALETLAAVEQARTPRVSVAPVGNAPSELRRAMTVNWVGPVEPIVATLSGRAGYNFQTAGDKPGTPIIVSLDAVNQPVIDILRDIGLQLGRRGDVKVDSQSKMIEIHYPPHDAPSVGLSGDVSR